MAGKTTTTKKPVVRRTAAPKTKTSAVRKEAPSIKQEKPIFRAGTWITIVVLAVLIGFSIYLNGKKDSAIIDVTPISAPSPVFAATDGAPSSIEIKPADGETVRIARNAENVWTVEMPIEAEANQGLAEAAATQVSALQVLSPIDGKPSVFGLDNPAYIITVEFAG